LGIVTVIIQQFPGKRKQEKQLLKKFPVKYSLRKEKMEVVFCPVV